MIEKNKRTLVLQCIDKIGEKVKLLGWVNTIRDHGKITFIDLRDRSGIIQCVGQDLPKFGAESVIEITGEIKNRPEKLVNENLKTGKIEVQIENLSILSSAAEIPMPLDNDA